MRKLIKKILNLIGWIAVSLLLLIVITTIVINSPKVQNYFTQTTIDKLQERLGNKISYSKMRLTVFNKVNFSNLLITDQKYDTIIFAPSMQVGFPGLIRKLIFHRERPTRIGSLNFSDSYFRLFTDTAGVINIQFIIDSLSAPKDTINSPSKPLYLSKIKVDNSRFAFIKADSSKKDFGIDFSNMLFQNLSFNIKKFVVQADTVNFNIKEMSFIEKSGFHIKDLSSLFSYSKKYIHFNNFACITKESAFKIDKLTLDYDSIKNLGTNKLYSDVLLQIDFDKSIIMLGELGYFSKFFQGMSQSVELTGQFNGTINDLNCRNLELKYGTGTSLVGKFDITGLPVASSTFLLFDIAQFQTNTADMETFQLPGGKKLKLPPQFSALTNITYNGNFTGFFRDFVSYGTLKTNLGIITTDILFQPDSVNRVTFSGLLSSRDFNIGALLGSKALIGNISFDMDVDGLGYLDKTFDIDLNGNISQFEVNNYNYRNIDVDGQFSKNRFNGKLNIDDPNLRLTFVGLVDLSSKIRQYKFLTNVTHANLYALNFDKKDPNYIGSFLLDANLSGNSLDEINGNLKLLNSFFSKTDVQIQVYDLFLDIENDSSNNKLKLTSDFLDAEINGQYKISQLTNEFNALIRQILPALSDTLKTEKELSYCDFNYKLMFKNSLPLFKFFIPKYQVLPKTIITGNHIRNGNLESKLHIQSPGVSFNKTHISDVVINTETKGKAIEVDFGCSSLAMNERLKFENITFESVIDSNRADYVLRWLNWDSSLYKGSLSGNLAFLNKPGQKPSMLFQIDSSSVIINDSLWLLSPFTLLADSNLFKLDKFTLWHDSEFVSVNGILSDNESDSLLCRFSSFDFANFNFLTRSATFRFGGILDGNAIIKGFKSPLFLASLFVKNLELNGETIGDTHIKTHWVDDLQALNVEANAMRGNLNTLKIEGNYFTKDDRLDFGLDFTKFRLEFVNPYLNNVFDDIKGVATGVLTLKGSSKEFKLDGELNLQKAAFTVDYLKTRYNFTSVLGISNNNLIFNNITLYDIYGNTSTLNGIIKTEYFRKYFLDFTISTNKFLCLNTTNADNKMFFGTAFATGIIKINGEPSSLKFNVTSRTDEGTVFNIPVSNTEELSEYNFIKYITGDSTNVATVNEEYKVNLLGMQLDFNLKVTPEATVKIIFDPTMGDEITGTGSGDMRISINTLGDFKIVGDYIIDEGTYLFTLQNVLANWKFKVEPGSTLRWTGDPVNADVNIKTYLRRKVSLVGLDPQSFETKDNSLGSSSYNHTVDCVIELTGKLMNPEVNFDVKLPFAEQSTQEKVKSLISTKEEKGKQFLALLIMKKFLPANPSQNETDIGGGEIFNANASELLSNQLNNWLSQLSSDFDLGFNYKPGTEQSEQEVEFILGKQFFNDRLSVNGSVDMKTNAEAEQATSFVGDVDIDYKITKNGRLRTKAYNKANEKSETNTSPYTQGFGFFYTEEFDKFSEVTKRYSDALHRRGKKKQNEKEKENLNRNAVKTDEEILN